MTTRQTTSPTTSRNLPARTGVLVVGAGEAGVRVAASLRELGYDRPILLLGEEPHRPYQRPPLSKTFLDGTADHDALALRTPEFYAEAAIDLRTGRMVTHVDLDGSGAGAAHCEDGDAVAFDHLVLATGARARTLPVAGADLTGVCTLRSLQDAEALRERLASAGRVVVLGAGYIGLEAAAVTSARGLDTTVVERADRLLSRVSAAPLSEFLLARHREWGVDFRLGTEVEAVVGDGGRARGVRLGGGQVVPADLVVVGVGAVPETALAEKLGLRVQRGIAVDAAGRTSHPMVFAAGDCTVRPHPHLPGELLGVESVQNANEQARAVAASIAGVTPPAPPVPWFWSDQRDLKLQIAGISGGHDRYVIRGHPGDGDVSVLYYRAGALIASESVNRPKDFMAVKRALGKGATIPPRAAADAATPLKDLILEPA
ncbi:NAD(P)/FAD-dependent oxidoreductase [Pseudonocardia halophobica]|uniref:NAD(P)/FAD-dependent oxidoreductase n=1 Tax=Pseudonocardia halophobica TaxID=29401 RepID=UPI003D8C4FBD